MTARGPALAALLALAAAPLVLAAGPAAAQATFSESLDGRTRTIERRDGACVQAVEIVDVQPQPTLGYRRGAACGDELAAELRGFGQLLDRALARLPGGRRPASLYWRRVEQPVFQRRLAAATLDAGLADLDDAALQRRLPPLLDQRGVFVELVAIFESRGLALDVAGLEKLERVAQGGGRPPRAAQLWFRIRPLAR